MQDGVTMRHRCCAPWRPYSEAEDEDGSTTQHVGSADAYCLHCFSFIIFNRYNTWAFSVCGLMAWNSLPDDFCDSLHSSGSFRHSLKTAFFYIIFVYSLQCIEVYYVTWHWHWVTLSCCNTKVLHQTLNPTAEFWCKTLSRSRFDF